MTMSAMFKDPKFGVCIEVAVPFYDVDAMGVVWHGNYFRYFEMVREALLQKFHYSYREIQASGYVWPIIDTRAKYIASATFEQKIIVHAKLVECENRLKIEYKVEDKLTGRRLATGYTIQVAVDEKTSDMCFACPQILLDKLGVVR